MKIPETMTIKIDADFSDFEEKARIVEQKYQELRIAIENLKEAEIIIDNNEIKKQD